MINLTKMSQKEYLKYRENEIDKYARMKVDTDKWEPVNSYNKAESELRHCLPSRPSDEGLEFLTIIALDTGNCVGTICYGRPPNQSTHETCIYDIRIHDDYRRKGYGRMALSKLEDRLRNSGVKTIVLDVSVQKEPAAGLYSKIGYTTTHFRMKKIL